MMLILTILKWYLILGIAETTIAFALVLISNPGITFRDAFGDGWAYGIVLCILCWPFLALFHLWVMFGWLLGKAMGEH